MEKDIIYRQNNEYFFKIDKRNSKIYQLHDNNVIVLDYDSNIDIIYNYIPLSLNKWQELENKFFISRNFEWVYNEKKYRTTDKKIVWSPDKHGGHTAIVFNKGKIWVAHNNANYYPRVYLEIYRDDTNISATRLIYGDSKLAKWTDIKYCKHFEEY